ncbi:SCO family protein [Sulfuricella sp.]|uniref:SCO family protein n=1 Tax=Sulfuricella sp. TaxID=2099377 RepID=UPI002C363ADD|nr:SCO family protein [Sulfuricella sp.]HUX62169.1 SCO family protein [Sulfuricella sp.]
MNRLYLAILASALLFAAPARAETPSPVVDDQPEIGIVSRYLLMDHKGRAISDQDFLGSFQLIAFGYTFCPDICPTTLAEMSLIMEKLGTRAEQLQPLFVTVDPERDTPEVLSRYTAYFHPRIIGLTGSPELVRRVADHFKVRYEKHWEPGAGKNQYTVDHSAGMYLLGPDGSFLGKFAYATPPQEVADRIRALMDEVNLPPTAKRPAAKQAH